MRRVTGQHNRTKRSFWRREDGHATIELVIIFPALLFLMLSCVELGLINFRQTMLSRGLDTAVREVRLSAIEGLDHESLVDLICDHAFGVPSCGTTMRLEMRPVDPANWDALPPSADCIDRSEPLRPVREFDPGGSNQLMLLRACIKQKPLFTTIGVGNLLKHDGAGNYALVARSAFVQEP